jgi:hypothetical protein
MAIAGTLRYTRIPLTHGSGAIPAVGFGTLMPDPLATKRATKIALEVGFRHLDCAERYRREHAVGDAPQAAFKAGTIRREDVFVTIKLWNTNHRPERVKPAFDASRRRLQVESVDCYFIHTPFDFRPGDEQDKRDELGQVIYGSGVTLVETWRRLRGSCLPWRKRRVQLIGPVFELFQDHRLGCTPAAHGVQTHCRIRGQLPHLRCRCDVLSRCRDGLDASPEVP